MLGKDLVEAMPPNAKGGKGYKKKKKGAGEEAANPEAAHLDAQSDQMMARVTPWPRQPELFVLLQ